MPRIDRLFVLVFAITFLLGILPVQLFAAEEIAKSKIAITEIKLGGDGWPEEFVSIYNRSQEEINLDKYKFEYIKDDFLGDCVDLNWHGSPSTIRFLDGVLRPNEVATFKYNLTNDKTLTNERSGSIRVVEQDVDQIIIHDLVGWGDEAVCYEGSPAAIPGIGKSLKRYLDCSLNLPLDTDVNSDDFEVGEIPSPGELSGELVDCPDSEPGKGGGTNAPSNICMGVIITEILPNPSGLDTGNEFMELYNPTSSNISLEGCAIETSANNKIYTFADTEIGPKQYMALYDSLTGLTLANSSGGSVYLVYADNSEQEIEYLPGLDEDVAWALDLSTNTWSITYVPTPGEKNKIVETKPCPIGQFRNVETNRCNKIAAVGAGLGPCPTGKFRNPETNRCKSILDAGSQLKPCNSGQFRNPETNRCKSLNSSSSLTPCKPGQKRNPETNRCRKVTSVSQASKGNDIKDVLSLSDSQNRSGWVLAGLSFAGASLYAVWEWRSEVSDKLASLRRLATGR